MSIAHDSDDRLPTTGPMEASYERYRFVTTPEDAALVYDAESERAWVESTWAVSLEAWR